MEKDPQYDREVVTSALTLLNPGHILHIIAVLVVGMKGRDEDFEREVKRSVGCELAKENGKGGEVKRRERGADSESKTSRCIHRLRPV